MACSLAMKDHGLSISLMMEASSTASGAVVLVVGQGGITSGEPSGVADGLSGVARVSRLNQL